MSSPTGLVCFALVCCETNLRLGPHAPDEYSPSLLRALASFSPLLFSFCRAVYFCVRGCALRLFIAAHLEHANRCDPSRTRWGNAGRGRRGAGPLSSHVLVGPHRLTVLRRTWKMERTPICTSLITWLVPATSLRAARRLSVQRPSNWALISGLIQSVMSSSGATPPSH
jgi:hypothetical protein